MNYAVTQVLPEVHGAERYVRRWSHQTLGTQVLSVHSLKLACWNGRAERGVPRHANRTADYIRVVDSITAQIRGGELAPGDKLPTCAQLADHFKVSVTTTQTALRILRERGLVEGHQGKGTYVAERPDPV